MWLLLKNIVKTPERNRGTVTEQVQIKKAFRLWNAFVIL
jgi:hypothetical protein